MFIGGVVEKRLCPRKEIFVSFSTQQMGGVLPMYTTQFVPIFTK